MDNLYKTIRTMAKLNQEQFAKELGTTVLSINRWENGKAAPSLMAQKQLYELCKSNSLILADYIVSDSEYKLFFYFEKYISFSPGTLFSLKLNLTNVKK